MNAGRFVWTPWAVLASFGLATLASFKYLGVDFIELLTGESARQMAAFASGFYPPDLSYAFLQRVATGAAETLSISALGTLLAVLAGALLALPASGRWGWPARGAARLLLNLLRSIPELV